MKTEEKAIGQALLLASELLGAVHHVLPGDTKDVLRIEHAQEIANNVRHELFPGVTLSRDDKARVVEAYRAKAK